MASSSGRAARPSAQFLSDTEDESSSSDSANANSKMSNRNKLCCVVALVAFGASSLASFLVWSRASGSKGQPEPGQALQFQPLTKGQPEPGQTPQLQPRTWFGAVFGFHEEEAGSLGGIRSQFVLNVITDAAVVGRTPAASTTLGTGVDVGTGRPLAAGHSAEVADAPTGDFRTPYYRMTSAKDKSRAWNLGSFERPRVAELRARWPAMPADKHTVKLKWAAAGLGADAGTLHNTAAHDSAHCTIQMASQFNCLEFVGPSQKPSGGITAWSGDKTQGPACACSTAPSSLYVNYWLNSDAAQMDNLEDVGPQAFGFQAVPGTLGPIDTRSGYTGLVRSGSALENFHTMMARLNDDESLRAKAMENLRVGIFRDTQVTAVGNFGSILPASTQADGSAAPPMHVTHVYSSALSLGAYAPWEAPTDAWEPLARVVLEATYEAAFLAALDAMQRWPDAPGARKLYLTHVGGGAFGNNATWIDDAIAKAVHRYAGYELEVYLVNYPSAPDMRALNLKLGFKPVAV